ncbi:MAG: hypothetical protein KF688_17305 [Pirellulales bacterium]|nr:hypothetical protein [Pirellulales bacterium]
MNPLLAAIAAPAALTVARTAGTVVAGGVESFADALSGAFARSTGTEAPSADQPETRSLRDRLEQRLAAVLAPFWGSGDQIGVSVDRATGELAVHGDSPAAEALRTALAEDPHLQDDLRTYLDEESAKTNDEVSFFSDVFAASRSLQIELLKDGLALSAAE